MLYIQYFVLSFFIVYLSLFLSKYVDELDKKTSMSGAFIGGILLAAVTSLPEFMTSISAIFILDEPSLVQGNVLGSNVFNFIIISLAVIIFPKKFKFAKISKNHIFTGLLTIIMVVIVYFGFSWDYIISLKNFNINLASILILVLYFINLRSLNSEESSSDEENASLTNLTVKQICVRFLICSILLVIVSILLTNTTSRLNEELNLGATVGGAIFLGVVTSLPELTSSISLAKLGNFNASFGNIFGSNIFNLTILSVSDILYKDGNIFISNSEALNLIFWGLISSVLVLCLFFTQRKLILSYLISILVIICYVSSIVFSI